jgi:hypothetical protein
MPIKTLDPPARTAPILRHVVEPAEPLTQTKPQRHSDGWFTRLRHRVKLAIEGDDEELQIANTTVVSWHVYHKSHQLGILDPWETRTFRLRKHGNLNVRPNLASDEVEYLVIDLNSRIQRVEIYRRQMGPVIDVYDMRVA